METASFAITPTQLAEAFPDFDVHKEGTGADHMVTILVDGPEKEAWTCDSRVTPILAADTTNLAVIAVKRAINNGERKKRGCCTVS